MTGWEYPGDEQPGTAHTWVIILGTKVQNLERMDRNKRPKQATMRPKKGEAKVPGEDGWNIKISCSSFPYTFSPLGVNSISPLFSVYTKGMFPRKSFFFPLCFPGKDTLLLLFPDAIFLRLVASWDRNIIAQSIRSLESQTQESFLSLQKNNI